jgi:hypothetical protein
MGVKRLLVVHDGLALEAGERLVAVLKTIVFARQKNAEKQFRSKSIKYSLHKVFTLGEQREIDNINENKKQISYAN